jgi:predicted Fe-Mo cluster-binding NifX family protein
MKDIKLAIPVFGDQVSPRFDCAQSILFVGLIGGKEVSRRSVPITGMNGIQQMKSISMEGVAVIICGGMPGFYHRMAEAIGVEVIHASGSVEEILDCIKRGENPPNTPQCCPGRGYGFGRGAGNRCGPGRRDFNEK